MWLHVIVFIMTLAVLLCDMAGLTARIEGIRRKGIRLFLLAAFCGNLLGAGLTYQSFRVSGEAPGKLVREEGMSHEESFLLSVDGEPQQKVSILVPAKEEPDADAEDGFSLPGQEQIEKNALVGQSVERYNREKKDPDYYYLPEELDGRTYAWSRAEDRSGQFLTGLFFAGGLFALIYGGREEQKKEEKRREQLLLDYPPLIMKFTLLIQAGLPVRRALERIAQDYLYKRKKDNKGRKKDPGGQRYAYEEIVSVCHELESGISEAEAYRHLGERCNEIRYRTLSTLLIQNLQKGNRQLSDLLEKESANAWEERKRKARVLGETASTRLLVPMILMLILVMAIIMIPAFLSFYSG